MKGLDEIREKCGIYIQLHFYQNGHMRWYLSTENINFNSTSITLLLSNGIYNIQYIY